MGSYKLNDLRSRIWDCSSDLQKRDDWDYVKRGCEKAKEIKGELRILRNLFQNYRKKLRLRGRCKDRGKSRSTFIIVIEIEE